MLTMKQLDGITKEKHNIITNITLTDGHHTSATFVYSFPVTVQYNFFFSIFLCLGFFFF